MTFWILSILLSLKPVVIVTFSSGAPLSACDGDMVPRHGYEAQAGDPPVELVMDQYTMVSDQYLRVTIRSKRAFKGFFIRADSDSATHLGTWYIPYLEDTSHLSESSYLHCQGRTQSAVTHSGRTNSMFLISLQWKPPADFYGWVSFRATVVENYRVYWLDVSASPVRVISKGDTAKDTPEHYEVSREVTSNKRTSYYNPGHGSTHEYHTVINTMLLPRVESTISSVLKKDEEDLTVNNPDFTQVDYIDVQENDFPSNFVHESPLINEDIDFTQKTPVEVTHDWFSYDVKDVTKIISQKTIEAEKITNNVTNPSTFSPVPYFTTKHSSELVTEERVQKVATEENTEATETALSTTTTRKTITPTLPTATQVTIENKDQMKSPKQTTTKLVTEKFTTEPTYAVTANKSQRSPRPRIIEPTFIFTTDSPTRTSKSLNISTTNKTLISHFFRLTDDYNLDNIVEGEENDTKIVQTGEHNDISISMLNNSVLNTLHYAFEHNTEAENEEDLTEVIITSNITELDRMPRDNDGQGGEEFETLEGPYQRLQAHHGSWQNSASKCGFFVNIVIIIVVQFCL